jgi:ElaB/YqjD/DUF883 family membrane-anchored ribosome-binding protein
MTSKKNRTQNLIKNLSKEQLESIQDKLSHVCSETTSYAKANPLKAMGFSMLAGVVLAKLFSSRR